MVALGTKGGDMPTKDDINYRAQLYCSIAKALHSGNSSDLLSGWIDTVNSEGFKALVELINSDTQLDDFKREELLFKTRS